MPRTPNTGLRALLEEAGWSGAQLGAALRRVAAEHGRQVVCDRSMVSRWLSGTTPRPPAPTLLLEVLSRRLRRPISAVEAGLSRAPATVLNLSWEADPIRRLSALTRAEIDPGRPHLLNAGMYSLAALAIPTTSRQPRTVLPPAPARAGPAEVEHMQTMVHMFAEAAQRHGPGHVRTALAAYLGHDVTGYLQTTRPQHQQILSGAAQLTLLLGTMCAGSGADAPAQLYHHTAAQLAAEADDTTTYAIALRTMSAHAHDLGHHTPSVLHLAEYAATLTRRTAPIFQAYAQAHLAVIQAHHDKHAALTALAAAEHLHDQADSAPGPFTHYPVGALHYQRAQTLATLGDKPGAAGALTASLRLRAPLEHHATALTRARLAEVLLAQGHLDQALTHWQTFLDTYPALHSTQAARRLDTLRRLLHPHRSHPATAGLLAHSADLR